MLVGSSTSTAAPRRLLLCSVSAAGQSSSGVRCRAPVAAIQIREGARIDLQSYSSTSDTNVHSAALDSLYSRRRTSLDRGDVYSPALLHAPLGVRLASIRSTFTAKRSKSTQIPTPPRSNSEGSKSTSPAGPETQRHQQGQQQQQQQHQPPRYPPESPTLRQPFAAAQPPPRQHGAPRLIRYPPPDAEALVPPPAPPADTQPAALLYTYSRGPSSRLFSYRNAATAARATRRANPFARSPHTYFWPTTSTTSTLSSSFQPVSPSQVQEDLSTRPTAADTMGAQTTGVEASASSAGLTARKVESQVSTQAATTSTTAQKHDHDHEHAGHAHGLFGHSHSHSHGAEGSAEEADKLLAALKGKGDRGSNITVIGLIANLVLCGAKGVAGVFLHSASLLADAAHSLSDTFSDLVTLFCWKMSQKPASLSHPLGYGKFETMGGLGVSLVLVAGSFAIGMHSYGLLLEVLQPHLQQMPAGFQALSSLTGDIARAAGGILHDHTHSAAVPVATGDAASQVLGSAGGPAAVAQATEDHGVLDPNAMWFALISILVKEWLYRATLKIAREENSSVLEANAIHHRSDSLSSGVTFLAIGGSYLGFPVLDPLGGLLVAGLIGKQGAELLIGALNDLSDRGVQPEVLDDFENVLRGIIEEPASSSLDADSARLLGWKDLRAVRSGVSTFVDVTLLLAADTPLRRAQVVESRVREAITNAHKGVKEVRVRLEPQQ